MPYLDNILYTDHALERMDKRGLSQEFVEQTLANGEVIEEYETSEEAPYLMHWKQPTGTEMPLPDRHFHVVAADQSSGRTIVITAYNPASQSEQWDDDYKRRLD